MTYEVGALMSLRAEHVMPVDGPEGELHAHDYRVEVVATRGELDARGMVVDLDVLRGELSSVLDPLRDADLTPLAPADVEGVTVEVFARLVFDRLEDRIGAEGGERMRVRVWESETEFAGYAADLRTPGARPA